MILNSHFADPFLADASGLVLKAEGSDFKTVVVQGVVLGSPAANAGLQENDVITAVDGEPAGKYALGNPGSLKEYRASCEIDYQAWDSIFVLRVCSTELGVMRKRSGTDLSGHD